MGFSYFNPNPAGQKVGDCTVRAIAKATGKSWDVTAAPTPASTCARSWKT